MEDKDRKFPSNLENPIDNLILSTGKKFYKIFRSFNFTPNHLTFISLITGLTAIYLFYKKNFLLSAIIYFISYSFDVFDGNYARTYEMVTNFGDYFDHIKDLVVNVILIIVFIKYNSLKNFKYYIAITLILVVLMSLHLGCQEIYVEKDNPKNKSEYLSFLGDICKKLNLLEITPILRHFGCGTFALWVSIIIALNAYS